jgi:hypothetical protein
MIVAAFAALVGIIVIVWIEKRYDDQFNKRMEKYINEEIR